MTIGELKIELANILKQQPSMKVEWQSRKRVFKIQWKNGKTYATGEEVFQKAKELHKATTGKTYDFSFLAHRVYDKHMEIFI